MSEKTLPVVATAALDLEMVRSLAHVIDDLEKHTYPWARASLTQLLFAAEDQILDAPAPDLDTLSWKMTQLGAFIIGFEMDDVLAKRVALLQDDITRLLVVSQTAQAA